MSCRLMLCKNHAEKIDWQDLVIPGSIGRPSDDSAVSATHPVALLPHLESSIRPALTPL